MEINKQIKQVTNGTSTNNQSVTNISKPKDGTTTPIKQKSSTTNSTGSTTINQPQETFYGRWVIKKLIVYGPVGTYIIDDVKNILGRELSFSAEKASCFGDQINDLDDVAVNPVYKKTVVSRSDFATGYRNRLTFDSLGIKSDSTTEISAVDSKDKGCVFYIKDDNILILYGGGAYFELDRENTTYDLSKETYVNKNIVINYPQVVNLRDNNKQKTINQIIKRDALKAFDDNDSVEINYVIKLKNANILSIQYFGCRNTKDTPHPTNEFYTTNIDLNKGGKLRLTDLVNINDAFEKKFEEGEFIDWEGDTTSEASQRRLAVLTELNDLSANDLLKCFSESDDVGEANISNTYSYLTNDSIGISVNISHAIGDHAEFEIKYQEVADNLKAENVNILPKT